MKIATRRWGYGFRDVPVTDAGEVFECEDLNEREQRMIDLGYITKLRANAVTYKCRECPRQFSELSYLSRHGDRTHGRPLTPEEEDRRADTDEKVMPPVLMDRTAAARGVKRHPAR